MKRLFILSCFFCSCRSARPVAHAGAATYKVATVQKIDGGSVVTLQGVQGRYIVQSDTLKINDAIQVSWISKK